MKRTTNILDRIGSLIPGYQGYAKRDNQRKSDKELRETISLRLDEVEKDINMLLKKVVIGDKDLNFLEVEEIRKGCSTISSKIRFASYGATALFDKEQIKEDELETIYCFDEQLLEQANHLLLIFKQDQEANFLVAATRNRLKEIEGAFNERSHFIQFKGNK
jgi:hypothetical protein